jgi:COP9 signalosome complex subunit 1
MLLIRSQQLLSPGDIAIYGTLCALASFTRPAVKARVLDNNDFGVYIEQEPYVRELIDAYMTSKFKVVLELLEKFSVRPVCMPRTEPCLTVPQTRHYMDIHLSSHVHELTRLIRDKCLVLYLQPFASIKLERMSVAFGWSIDDIEKAVVGLIQSGDIKARVDSLNKVLVVVWMAVGRH